MDLLWIIYLVDTFTGNPIPTFSFLAFIIGFALICAAAFWLALALDKDVHRKPPKEEEKLTSILSQILKSKVLWGIMFWSIILAPLLNSFIPSRDTAYKMLAAYGVQEIMVTDEAKKIGSKSLEVLDKAMSDYLGEVEEVKDLKEEL